MAGFTDIQIVNNSGHGIDIVARLDGVIWVFEVKSSQGKRARSLTKQQRDSREFIETRLERAADAEKVWSRTSDPTTKDRAKRLKSDIDNGTPVETRKVEVTHLGGEQPVQVRVKEW
ncbi:MAG TPA: hypothetical protein ENK57_09475 [Polyangiaceae bacterium]|nr:hypothetical protein [Polyangiaceae bacterium]